MKFVLQCLVIALLAYLFELFLPWWSIAIAGLLGGYLLKSRTSFLAGFLAISIVWLLAAWKIDAASPSHLADKVAAIMQVNKATLMAIMAVIGGLTGGFAAMTGASIRSMRRRRNYY